jgi:hypothetical protein
LYVFTFQVVSALVEMEREEDAFRLVHAGYATLPYSVSVKVDLFRTKAEREMGLSEGAVEQERVKRKD